MPKNHERAQFLTANLSLAAFKWRLVFLRQSSILDMNVLNILYHIRICTHLYFSYFYIFLIWTSMIFFPFLRFLSFHLLYFFLKFSFSLLAVMDRNSTCVLVFHTIKKSLRTTWDIEINSAKLFLRFPKLIAFRQITALLM